MVRFASFSSIIKGKKKGEKKLLKLDEPVARKWAWCDFAQAAASRQTGHYILKKRKKKKKKEKAMRW